MEALHLDHAFDVQHMCELWKQLTPCNPVSWDQGIKGILVAHLLFGTQELGSTPANICLRCGISRGAVSTKLERTRLCHKQHGAHYTHVLPPDAISDLPVRKRLRPNTSMKCVVGDKPVSKRHKRDANVNCHRHEVREIEVIVIDD